MDHYQTAVVSSNTVSYSCCLNDDDNENENCISIVNYFKNISKARTCLIQPLTKFLKLRQSSRPTIVSSNLIYVYIKHRHRRNVTSHHFTSLLFTSFHFYVYSNFFGSYQLKSKYNTHTHIQQLNISLHSPKAYVKIFCDKNAVF